MQRGRDTGRSPIVQRLCDLHDRLTGAGFALAAALVGALAAAFCYEVVARYFFSAPTAWTYDVGCYLLAAVIFLSMPEMTRRGAHIHVNLVFDYLPPRGVRALRYLIGALAVAACLAATWITGTETWRQYAQGVWTLSALPIPKWWVSILIPYGMLSSALHFLRQLGRPPGAALASEASGQRGDSEVRAPDTRPEPGSSARAALASEASGQRGDSEVRAHSASEDARERADDTRPEPGSSAREAFTVGGAGS